MIAFGTRLLLPHSHLESSWECLNSQRSRLRVSEIAGVFCGLEFDQLLFSFPRCVRALRSLRRPGPGSVDRVRQPVPLLWLQSHQQVRSRAARWRWVGDDDPGTIEGEDHWSGRVPPTLVDHFPGARSRLLRGVLWGTQGLRQRRRRKGKKSALDWIYN